MRLARVIDPQGGSQLAEAQRDTYLTLDVELCELMEGSTRQAGGEPLSARAMLAPLQPGKVVTLAPGGRGATGLPDVPLIVANAGSSVIGPDTPIPIPWSVTGRVDWGVALAMVIGREARCVTVEDALDHVFGYTVANDVCAHLQFSDGGWIRARGLDNFCPLGPVLVTGDELSDPQSLRLTTRVNDELVQDAMTDLMVLDPATLVSICSQSFTLHPGDVVLARAGWSLDEPARPLAVGDVIECTVEGIGTLRNAVS